MAVPTMAKEHRRNGSQVTAAGPMPVGASWRDHRGQQQCEKAARRPEPEDGHGQQLMSRKFHHVTDMGRLAQAGTRCA